MWTGDHARYQSPELALYIRPADARLRAITGVEMTDAYNLLLDDTSIFLDSEPGCRAINTVKALHPSLVLTFASEIARARYIDGVDNTILSTFLTITQKLGINSKEFQDKYESEAMKKQTQEIFRQAGAYAKSYPSIFLLKADGRIVPIFLADYQYERISQEIRENIFDK